MTRVGGRLQYAESPEETKHQVVLPHGNKIIEKLVQETHVKALHAGPQATLSILRDRVWLTSGRREVKRVLRSCLVCQRQRVAACSQKMAPLPPERVSYAHPFTHVGLDFAGPVYIKVKIDISKTYICIFTCASSRIVHLELTQDRNRSFP